MFKSAHIDPAEPKARKILLDLISQGFSLAEASDIICTVKSMIDDIELEIVKEQGNRPLSDFIVP